MLYLLTKCRIDINIVS